MRPTMKSTPQKNQPRTTVRRATPDRRSDAARAMVGERREMDRRGVAKSMVDALSDILQWERESERRLRVSS
jgi:hypothetical protein